MTTPSLSVDTTRGRMYRLEPGGPAVYPSITTVAGMRSKEFLQGWHGRMAGKRALEMFAFLDRNPDRAPSEIRRVLADQHGSTRRIAEAAPDHTRRAADFGTLVHALCEQWERDGTRPDAEQIAARIDEMRSRGSFTRERDPGLLPREVAVRLDGFDRFLHEFSPDFIEIEQTVVNHSVGYAGTTDALLRIGGSLLSGDIKTSKAVHGDYSLQGAAVVHAEALLDDDGTEREFPDVTGAFIIHLPAQGGYSIVPLQTGPKQWDTFRALRTVWDFNEDECLGQPCVGPKELLLEVLRGKGSFA